MAKPGASIYITTFDSSKTLNTHTCLDKYDEVVEYIEGKIKEFNRQQNNGCEKWVELNGHINNKGNELNECYTRNLLTVYLNDSKEIRGFRDKYAIYPECSNNPSYRAEVPVKVQDKAENSCVEKKDCREKTKPSKQQAESKAKESKSQPGEGATTPETGTAKGQTHVNQGVTAETSEGVALSLKAPSREVNVEGSHVHNEYNGAGTEGASSQRVSVSRVRADSVSLVSPSSGDVIRGATSTDRVNPAATPTGEQARDVVTDRDSFGHTGAVREDKVYKNHACVTSSGRCVDSECTDDRNVHQPVTCNAASHSKTVGDGGGGAGNDIRSADGDTHQSSPVTASTPVGDNSSDLRASRGKQSDKSSFPEVASGLSHEGIDTVKEIVHQDAQCKKAKPFNQAEACPNHQLFHHEQVHEHQQGKEKEALSFSQVLEQPNPTNTVGNSYAQGSVETPINVASQGTSLLAQNSPSSVEDTGETVNFVDGIIMFCKKYILMSLIPLAIILLLTVLVKFTPLGMLFNNKKRKKRKDINAKLQRILQEPSMARDQRSVPFSYSSFGYSSY